MKFERIETLRKEYGYTQAQIADLLGLNRNVYRRMKQAKECFLWLF